MSFDSGHTDAVNTLRKKVDRQQYVERSSSDVTSFPPPDYKEARKKH